MLLIHKDRKTGPVIRVVTPGHLYSSFTPRFRAGCRIGVTHRSTKRFAEVQLFFDNSQDCATLEVALLLSGQEEGPCFLINGNAIAIVGNALFLARDQYAIQIHGHVFPRTKRIDALSTLFDYGCSRRPLT